MTPDVLVQLGRDRLGPRWSRTVAQTPALDLAALGPGHPTDGAAVVVRQVADTARAIYSVGDYTRVVTIRTGTAVRHIASGYPYTGREGELSEADLCTCRP